MFGRVKNPSIDKSTECKEMVIPVFKENGVNGNGSFIDVPASEIVKKLPSTDVINITNMVKEGQFIEGTTQFGAIDPSVIEDSARSSVQQILNDSDLVDVNGKFKD